jgi:DNA-binding CsgD family transcriptional regulator/PAS domain-containing protein
MARASTETVAEIIGDIYDCSLSPDKWAATLTRITQSLDAAYTTISLGHPGAPVGRMAVHSPWCPEKLRELNEDYGVDGVPGLRDVVFGDLDHPRSTLEQMTEAEFQTSPFYRNWVRPQNLREACVVKVVHTADRFGIMASITRATRDALGEDERQLVAILSPHIRRASMIGDLLDHRRVALNVYRTALDELATPIVLTGADARVQYANRAAERLLAGNGPLTSTAGLLAAANPVATPALIDAIARTAGSEGALGGRGIGIPISAPGQSPAIAYVLPLSNLGDRALLAPAAAAVFISTTTSSAPPPEAALATLFDLTPAEARVFCRIGSGQTITQAGDDLQIGSSTLKTHLNRIFAKTGAARQSDLIQIYNDISSPSIGGS